MIKTVYCHLRVGMMTSVLCSEVALWAVQRTASEGRQEKRRTSLCSGYGHPWGDPAQAKGSGSWMTTPVVRPGGTRVSGHPCHPPQCLCPLEDLGCVGLLLLEADAVVPVSLPCWGMGVLLPSFPKELRTIPETNFPPYGSCID